DDQFARQLRLEKAILLVLVVMSQSQRQSQRLTQPKLTAKSQQPKKNLPPAKANGRFMYLGRTSIILPGLLFAIASIDILCVRHRRRPGSVVWQCRSQWERFRQQGHRLR
ncbi:MAG: hypothetical protein AB7E34_09405, partial [Acidaminococcaceae bacterium]